MSSIQTPQGDSKRDAIESLSGYIYQIYQSAIAWLELRPEEFLFLEVAEDYVIAASNALNATQVKETTQNVTINSDGIVASIDSFIQLKIQHSDLKVKLRHLTTSNIGKEKSNKHRVGETPTLILWRQLAKAGGNLSPLKEILLLSKLSPESKGYISTLNDSEFRDDFLKLIHFDCGAPSWEYLPRILRSKLGNLINERGGNDAQVTSCLNEILIELILKASQEGERSNRYVDRNDLESMIQHHVQISVDRANFEAQQVLISQLLAESIPSNKRVITGQPHTPTPLNAVSIPSYIIPRNARLNLLLTSLRQHGICWVNGATGVGKTIITQLCASQLGDGWGRINLRCLTSPEVNEVLSKLLEGTSTEDLNGILLDDLDCQFEPSLIDRLLTLFAYLNRSDKFLLITSAHSPDLDFTFRAELPIDIGVKIEEFSQEEVEQILENMGVDSGIWGRYIHLVSGNGHPQLVAAAIQSMQANNWDLHELRTLDSLLTGNEVIERVRLKARNRLLQELPDTAREILERLSLKPGSFSRNLVLHLAHVAPAIIDGGLQFEQLIGSWIDQQEKDKFSLSPLLSNFAKSTLNSDQQKKISFEIAEGILKEASISPIEANSALMAALIGDNASAILQICLMTINQDPSSIKLIAPHLITCKMMRTDKPAYPTNPNVSHVLRGTQLILLSIGDSSCEKFVETLQCYKLETSSLVDTAHRNMFTLLVYSKLLLSEPDFGAIPEFWNMISTLNNLLLNQDGSLPTELLSEIDLRKDMPEGSSVVSFMFAYQVRQMQCISSLIPLFKYLDACSVDFRRTLLKAYNYEGLDIEMLPASAWLNEHTAGTINPNQHIEVYETLEKYALNWNEKELAAVCRKYMAVIADEYDNDKDRALEIIDEGLKEYGPSNSILLRAKAKILFRSDDHLKSLELSNILLSDNLKISSTEKAFFCRDAAVSAEKISDYSRAEELYLEARKAIQELSIDNIQAMRTGLLADAALSNWHAGERKTCLQKLYEVFLELASLDPNSCLQATYCHATSRHILLWLTQDVTGTRLLAGDGYDETTIYPGIISNPEPNPEIEKHELTSLDMAWYMLATLEQRCFLDIGISNNLKSHLMSDSEVQGEILLTSAKLDKAIFTQDLGLFLSSLGPVLAQYFSFKQNSNPKELDTIPTLNKEQQKELTEISELYVLSFLSAALFQDRNEADVELSKFLPESADFVVREEFNQCLYGTHKAQDFNTSMAILLKQHFTSLREGKPIEPIKVFHIAYKTLLVAKQISNLEVTSKSVHTWLVNRLEFILENQRFQLITPSVYENSVAKIIAEEHECVVTGSIDILLAIMPMMGINNPASIINTLEPLRQ